MRGGIRGVVVGVAAAVVTVAALVAGRTPTPDLVLVAGLLATHVALFLVPIVGDAKLGRRPTLHVGMVLVEGFALPPEWAVLVSASAALLSGLYIRRHRTTPGGVVFAVAWVSLGAAGAAVTIDQLTARSVTALAVLGTAAAGWLVYQAVTVGVLMAVWSRRFARDVIPFFAHLAPAETAAPIVAIGALGGFLALHEPGALLLAVLPLVALLRYGSGRGRALEQLDRLSAVLDLAREASATADVAALEAGLIAHTSRMLDAPVRIGAPPGPFEIGAPVASAGGGDRWLVAERRGGPPSWQGRYRSDDRVALERIAAIGSTAAQNLRLLEEIRHIAAHDRLTGLANRARFDEELSARIARAERSGQPFALVLVDLDHFKLVNDTHGHPTGDHVLHAVARRLRELARSGDTTARWGGEEFVVLADLQGPTGAAAQQLGQRIVRGLRGRVVVPGGSTVAVSASVGIAVYPDHGLTATTLVAEADLALLGAKGLGRDRAEMAGGRGAQGLDGVVATRLGELRAHT